MTFGVRTALRGIGTTIFSEMTALAQRTGAVNLGQGFPDTDGPAGMLAAAQQAIAGGLNQYPPVDGLPVLKEAIVQARQNRYGMAYDPATEVVMTAGATEAIAAALLALCEPGDEVVLFEPYYDSYLANVAMAGATHRAVPLRPTDDAAVAGSRAGAGFAFDPDDLRRAVSPRTRLIVLNSPHNPTGKVFTRAELELIAQVCVERDLIAVTDEVYEYLTYDGLEHVPLASLPGMRERTVTISSAGKTFSCTGWKIGWALGPAELVGAVRKAKQFMTFASGTPFQAAVAHALTHELDWVAELAKSLQERRDLLQAGLTAAGVRTYPAHGTYFLQADAASWGYADGGELCRDLAEHGGVVAIPTQVFYDDPANGRGLVRFAFCKRPEVLADAVSRLSTFRPSEGK
ncbi:MAG: pyridoxal phosphate-dependent aminotransferase [Hamadaea sp.]|uniref:pyridoxal phosphate-dependent aminotransferase n=1 Tax=Hamadaea sp. TaxID=2024425 RepID=UPI0017D6249E|nr:pyridoxal phosphate-dependent aminotransferase [Hamadaea sp.]NUR74348.1 pyridoxal phosphate-dependent aminotransferase [Hamadaea sp.]NUT20995.1 pyridoxal phosphate-dependent aminotransferase [Hamadaea sp.]